VSLMGGTYEAKKADIHSCPVTRSIDLLVQWHELCRV
jgi:hypothetical protein